MSSQVRFFLEAESLTVLSLMDKMSLGNLGPLLSLPVSLISLLGEVAEVVEAAEAEGTAGDTDALAGGVGSFNFNLSAFCCKLGGDDPD